MEPSTLLITYKSYWLATSQSVRQSGMPSLRASWPEIDLPVGSVSDDTVKMRTYVVPAKSGCRRVPGRLYMIGS